MTAATLRDPTSDEVRTYLAGERTLMAWVRTGVSLTGFGFLVERFGLFMRELAATRPGAELHSTGLSAVLGTCLVLVGVAVNLYAISEHLRFIRRFQGTELARVGHSWFLIGLASTMALIGVAMAAFLIVIERRW